MLLILFYIYFWATVCKTETVALCYRTVVMSVLSCPVCDVGVLWPNGWTDQDETWLGMEVGLGPGHTVRWGSSSPTERGTATPRHWKFTGADFTYVRIIRGPCLLYACSQTAGWIKMKLGMEVAPSFAKMW